MNKENDLIIKKLDKIINKLEFKNVTEKEKNGSYYSGFYSVSDSDIICTPFNGLWGLYYPTLAKCHFVTWIKDKPVFCEHLMDKDSLRYCLEHKNQTSKINLERLTRVLDLIENRLDMNHLFSEDQCILYRTIVSSILDDVFKGLI